jgi:hypothetical protein
MEDYEQDGRMRLRWILGRYCGMIKADTREIVRMGRILGTWGFHDRRLVQSMIKMHVRETVWYD